LQEPPKVILFSVCSLGPQSVKTQYTAEGPSPHRPGGGFGIGQVANFPIVHLAKGPGASTPGPCSPIGGRAPIYEDDPPGGPVPRPPLLVHARLVRLGSFYGIMAAAAVSGTAV
jgi:hypothetical protein